MVKARIGNEEPGRAGASHYPDAKPQIWVYDVDGESLTNPRVFAMTEMDGKAGFAAVHKPVAEGAAARPVVGESEISQAILA